MPGYGRNDIKNHVSRGSDLMGWDEQWLENYYKKHPKAQIEIKGVDGVKRSFEVSGKDIYESMKKEQTKKSKYSNKKIIVDGIYFDSQLEADYYSELKLRLRAGDIKGFCRQPEFILVEGNETERAITYKADFIVFNLDGTAEVIDTKGYESEQWKRTYKMFRIKYPDLELKIEKR